MANESGPTFFGTPFHQSEDDPDTLRADGRPFSVAMRRCREGYFGDRFAGQTGECFHWMLYVLDEEVTYGWCETLEECPKAAEDHARIILAEGAEQAGYKRPMQVK
jgi:hypothetical protein